MRRKSRRRRRPWRRRGRLPSDIGCAESPWKKLQRTGELDADANANHLIQRADENLAVADLAGARGLHDRLDRAFDQVVWQRDLQFHLGQEIHHVLRAAVQFGVAFLSAETLDFRDGDAGHADFRQRLARVVQLERLDDRGDEFHRCSEVLWFANYTRPSMREHLQGWLLADNSQSTGCWLDRHAGAIVLATFA